jgi:hypothetical protein
MSGSFLLTGKLADRAIDLVLPAITAAMEMSIMKRHDLHIVVMSPCIKPWHVTDPLLAILTERSFGDMSKWEYPYSDIARAKTVASWRTGLPTNLLIHAYPHLLEAGIDWSDTKFYGSGVFDGIPTGASGAQGYFDEWVAGIVGLSCKALCMQQMRENVLVDGSPDFLWNPVAAEEPIK